MTLTSIAARRLAMALLLCLLVDGVLAHTARADVIIPDYGYYQSSTGIYRFDENTGAAVGAQPFANIGPPDAGYEAVLYLAEGSTYGPDGNLYVGFQLGGAGVGEVRQYNAVTGAYMGTTVAPGSGGLKTPGDLKFIDGTLYVADHDGATVDTYTMSYAGGVATATPSGSIDFGANSGPSGLLVDTRPAELGGNQHTLLVSLFGSNQVVEYNLNTQAITPFVAGGGSPGGIGFGPDGSLYVANVFSGEIQHFAADGTPLDSLPELPSYPGGAFPGGVLYTQGGDLLVSTLVPAVAPILRYTGDEMNPWAPFASASGLGFGGPMTLTPIAGDTNGDGLVNLLDLTQIASHWNTAGPTGDANANGLVELTDLTLVAGHWGDSNSIFVLPGGAGASLNVVPGVPEPSTFVLTLTGFVAVLAGRARRWRASR